MKIIDFKVPFPRLPNGVFWSTLYGRLQISWLWCPMSERCNCSQEICNHITGCMNISGKIKFKKKKNTSL